MTAQLTTRTVASVMTRNPVAVPPHTSYPEVLELLTERAIGAVPVLSATGRVVGVVSEADLLRTGRKSRHRRRRTREVGRLTAAELMTSPAITVRSDATLAHAARLLADSGKRQLFVVDDGRLVGALGRRDVLGQFLRPDKDILAEIEHDIFTGPANLAEPSVRVSVEHGFVQLTGWLPRAADIDTAVLRIAAVPGVLGIADRLVAAFDDRNHASRRAR
ncbi:MAG: CBS domain-containing protein [Labedaea sp.]